MKKFSAILFVILIPWNSLLFAQPNLSKLSALSFNQFGICAGINFTSVLAMPKTQSRPELGYTVGVFANKPLNAFIGIRNELTYTNEGLRLQYGQAKRKYSFRYIYLNNLFILNLGRFVQLQGGVQTGYLAKAFVDTGRNTVSSEPDKVFSISDKVKRVMYGGCLGIEIYPTPAFLVNVRYGVRFSTVNKEQSLPTSAFLEYASPIRTRSLTISLGYRFGEGIHR